MGIRPTHSFDPNAGLWGALQLVARYSELHIDPLVFVRELAAPAASANARSWAVGANWYPATPIRYYVMYERTAFDGGNGVRPSENVIILRMQLAF